VREGQGGGRETGAAGRERAGEGQGGGRETGAAGRECAGEGKGGGREPGWDREGTREGGPGRREGAREQQ
jgi:hypothetical protein